MGFNQHLFDDLTTRNHDFYGDVTIKAGFFLATQCRKPPIVKGFFTTRTHVWTSWGCAQMGLDLKMLG